MTHNSGTESEAHCNERRRNLLKLTGLLGLTALTSPLIGSEPAEALWFDKKTYKVSRTRLSMGTFVSMTAIHPSKDQAEEAFEAAFAEIDRLAGLLSRHDDSSPIAELNRTGTLNQPHAQILEVIERSRYYHQITGGAFDITVKPLMDLYLQKFDMGLKPGEGEIEKTLALVGANGLQIAKDHLSFTIPGMGITLDGIAKGYIVDRASEVLKAHSIHNHLINAGGDIRTSGQAAGGKRWTIAIQDPEKKREFPDIIKLAAGAVATSGNYEAFYDKEKLFHHIVDPHSGLSPQLFSSVSVTAPTVMDADAQATALFVLDSEQGISLINKLPDSECFIINRDSTVRTSSAWLG